MADYTTITDIWLNGDLVPGGTDITLSDAAAKYIKDALRPKVIEPVVEEPVVDVKRKISVKTDTATDGVAG